jgi:hypothetical protein
VAKTFDWPAGSWHLAQWRFADEYECGRFESIMPRSRLNFFSARQPFPAVVVLLVDLLIVFFEFGVIQYAYEKIGVDRRYVFALLMASLLGSYVNIPRRACRRAGAFQSGHALFWHEVRDSHRSRAA